MTDLFLTDLVHFQVLPRPTQKFEPKCEQIVNSVTNYLLWFSKKCEQSVKKKCKQNVFNMWKISHLQ